MSLVRPFRRFRAAALAVCGLTALVAGPLALPAAAGVPANFITISDAEVVEGDGGTANLVFTVARAGGDGVTTVDYDTVSGSATEGSDFTATSGTLTFEAGETEETITVPVTGDTTSEPNEAFFVNLANATNGTVGDTQARGAINNDDAPQVLYGTQAGTTANSDLLILDAATGAVVRVVGPIGFAVTGLALDPTTGILYGSTSNRSGGGASRASLITIDTETGAGTLVGDLSTPENEITDGAADITFTSDGTLYGWLEETDNLYEINKATGDATLVGESGLGTYGSGLAADANDTLYLAPDGANGDLYTIDRETGAATDVGDLTGVDDDSIGALAFACDGETLLGANSEYDDPEVANQLVHIDEETGALSYLGDSTLQLNAIEFRCPGGFEIASVQVNEDAGSVTLTVIRVGGAEGAVSVDFTTADGTATAGSDYTATSGTLDFVHGETTKTITIPITDDDDATEDNETFRVRLANAAGEAAILTPEATVTIVELYAPGYRLVAADGGIFTFGDRLFHGSTGDIKLNKPIVGGATDLSDYDGYWIVASDGGVFTFNAEFFGSLGDRQDELTSPAVEIEPTPTGKGYWIVLADGKVFTFGDAKHFGDRAGGALNDPIIGMSVTGTGLGYWLVAEDGGIFSYGDADFHGSMGGQHLNAPVIDLAPAADNNGYYLVAEDGGVFSFGSAEFKGSTGDITLNDPVVAMLVAPTGAGYWLAATDGGVFTFGAVPFLGSMGHTPLNSPVLDMIH